MAEVIIHYSKHYPNFSAQKQKISFTSTLLLVSYARENVFYIDNETILNICGEIRTNYPLLIVRKCGGFSLKPGLEKHPVADCK